MTVFVSHSRSDEMWKHRIVRRLEDLLPPGFVQIWENDTGSGSGHDSLNFRRQLDRASVAIFVLSGGFANSVLARDPETVRSLRIATKNGLRVVTVVVGDAATPEWLAPHPVVAALPDSASDPGPAWKEQLEYVAAKVRQAIYTPAYQEFRVHGMVDGPPERVDIAGFKQPGIGFVARDAELDALTAAWRVPERSVLSLLGPSGIGKTEIAAQWLEQMRERGFEGAQQVIAWRFGHDEEGLGFSGVDTFMEWALERLGDDEPRSGSPWARGERLARRFGEERALMLLDGIEAVCVVEPSGLATVRDPGLDTFLRSIGEGGRGLCVVTSRVALAALVGEPVIEVSPLGDEDITTLLRGALPGAQLREAVRRTRGYPVAARLLGCYRGALGSEALSVLLGAEPAPDAHPADDVVGALLQCLDDTGAMEALRLLCLFDQPSSIGMIATIADGPPVRGVNERLSLDAGGDIEAALAELEGLCLVERTRGGKVGVPSRVCDSVRDRMNALWPGSATTMHRRIARHYESVTTSQPRSAQEMMNLYLAMAHYARAGDLAPCVDIFWRRVCRGRRFYSFNDLGMVSENVAALARLFDGDWSKPDARIDANIRAVVLGWAAYFLRAAGRLEESVLPMRTSLLDCERGGEWREAATMAGNLATLHVFMGDLGAAGALAHEGLRFAGRAGDGDELCSLELIGAIVACASGDVEAAITAFERGVESRRQRHPGREPLSPSEGFWFGLALISSHDSERARREVLDRLERQGSSVGGLERGLGFVILAVADLVDAERGLPISLDGVALHLNLAHRDLARTGREDYLPVLMLIQANAARQYRHFDEAVGYLRTAERLALEKGLGLVMVDLALERVRLARDRSDLAAARECLIDAQALIERTGYGIRARDLAHLQRTLGTGARAGR